MNKIYIFFISFFMISTAWASNSTFEKLLEEVRLGTIFEQSTKSRHCPKKIILEESKYPPNDAKEGDRSIRMSGKKEEGKASEYFTFEGNSFHYRPNLSLNKSHTLKRKVEIVLGAAYTWSGQSDTEGVLTSEYSAKILSPVMITSSYFKKTYDSNTGTISYFFQGNGVDDVNCIFKKAVNN